MRVVLPYTDLRPEVLWAVQEADHEYETFDVSHSDTDYWSLLSLLWRCGEDFCIVEHDIVVGPGTLDSFEACPQEWCTSPYKYLRGTYWGLGCTRFRAPLMAAYPELLDEVGEVDAPGHGPKHWCTLDACITRALMRRRREWPHQDHGEVAHLSDGSPTHGCRA